MDFATAPRRKKKVRARLLQRGAAFLRSPASARLCAASIATSAAARDPAASLSAASPSWHFASASETSPSTTTSDPEIARPAGCEKLETPSCFFFANSSAASESAPLAARPNSTSAATCLPGAAADSRRRSEAVTVRASSPPPSPRDPSPRDPSPRDPSRASFASLEAAVSRRALRLGGAVASVAARSPRGPRRLPRSARHAP